jgi:hypothetical protein
MTPEPERGPARPTDMISSPRHLLPRQLGTSLALGVLLVSVLGLTACARTDDPAGSPGPASPSTPPSSSAPAPTGSAGEKLMTLTGTVGEGVEAGCTILTAGDQVYELQGANIRSLKGTVTVTGHVLHNVMTICQQGTPFRVVEVKTS